ncbi:hypothetical protein DL98DRAFT_587176 [Cadophora sp. DSE1049]|nr:hypothetical protein DL98DRAFT_587176 [Cadophora sp. DSE1049]
MPIPMSRTSPSLNERLSTTNYTAIGRYQYFWDLCPPDQMVSVHIKNKKPVLVSPATRQIIEFGIMGPNPWTIILKDSVPRTLVNGNEDGEHHSILGFPYPGSNIANVVVDMSRMQNGEVGRGTYEEFYFMGTYDDFCDSTEKNICTRLENRSNATHMNPSQDSVEEARLKACAERVWRRW